jgi:hypothetical protein
MSRIVSILDPSRAAGSDANVLFLSADSRESPSCGPVFLDSAADEEYNDVFRLPVGFWGVQRAIVRE